ncbi:hypothetical protein KME66_03425 [Streptomyces sp. YPW6]|nr:hypothetical protein KME66_03425 [Streptomyces sp. YPW6]
MAGHDVADPAQLALPHPELQVGQAHQQRVDADIGDGPADVLSRALVGAAAEGEVGPVAAHVGVEVGADGGVGVGRGDPDQEGVARLDLLTAQLGVTDRPAAEDGGERRLVPEGLLDRLGDGHVPAAEPGAEARVGQDHPQHVGDEVGGGLVRGDEDEAQVFDDLDVGHRRGVLDQPAGEVVGGFGAAALDQAGQHGHDVGVGGHGGLGAAGHVAGSLDEALVVLLGHAEDRAHHHHRQVLRELADQVGGALLAEVVDQAVTEAVDVAAHAAGVDALHAVGDRAALPLVLRAVGEDADGLPGEDRGERVVGGDAAVLEGPPAPRVPGELRRRAGEVEVLAVAEDEPGGDVAVEQDGGDGAVFGAELVVEARGVVLRLGAVEPAQSAGADVEVVGRALGRGHGAGFVVEGGCHGSSRDQDSKAGAQAGGGDGAFGRGPGRGRTPGAARLRPGTGAGPRRDGDVR